MQLRKLFLPFVLLASSYVAAAEPPSKEELQEKFKKEFHISLQEEENDFTRTIYYWIDQHTYLDIKPGQFGYGHAFADATRTRYGIIDYIIPQYEHEHIAESLFGDIAGDVALDLTPGVRNLVNRVDIETEKITKKVSINKNWISLRSAVSIPSEIGGRIVFPKLHDLRVDILHNKIRVGGNYHFDNDAFVRWGVYYNYGDGYGVTAWASISPEAVVNFFKKN